MQRILVLGIGDDDSGGEQVAGMLAARRVGREMPGLAEVRCGADPLALMVDCCGSGDEVVVVDVAPGSPPGAVERREVDLDAPPEHLRPTVDRLRDDDRLPDRLTEVTIHARHSDASAGISPEVCDGAARAAQTVAADIRRRHDAVPHVAHPRGPDPMPRRRPLRAAPYAHGQPRQPTPAV